MALPSSRARRASLRGLVALVACGQVSCALEIAGLTLPASALVLAGIGAVVLAAALTAMRAPAEPRDLAPWALVGLTVWVIWGTCYFGAAHVTDPPNAKTFDDSILQRLPLVPAFAAVYLGVHFFSMVPYCALPETRLLRRYLLGNMLIVLLSGIAWVSLPVRLDRPPFSADAPGFGAWLLHGVYRWDPTTNCFPSAHCAVAVYAAIALRHASRRLFAWGVFTAGAICTSTVMTKQHYVADVVSGAVVAAIAGHAMRRRPPQKPALATPEPARSPR